MYFSPILGPAAVEELIDVLLSHESLLLLGGINGLASDSFVEFSRAVLPQCVGVDSPKDVGNISGKCGDRRSFFLLLAG